VGRTGAVIVERMEAVADPRATTALARASRDPEAKVRRAALRALLQHAGEEVIAATMEAARAGRDAVEVVPLLVRAAPADLEALLLAYAQSEDEVGRAAGARGLGRARLVSSRPRLLALLDDASPLVFAAAHGALRELEGFPAAEMPEDVALDRALLTARWKARHH
jgi:HEAT repeat protein